MEKLFPVLFKAAAGEKGRDKARAALLLLVAFVAWKITTIDTRLAVVEALLRVNPGVTVPGLVTPASHTNQLARSK